MTHVRPGRISVLILGCCLLLSMPSRMATAAAQIVSAPLTAQGFATRDTPNVVIEWNAIAQDAIVTVGAQPIQGGAP